jgi:hypothetical protein
MNENLKKLLEQASIYAFDSRFVPGDNPRHVADVMQEKFAELIVQECASVAAKNQAEDMDWDIAEIIKEHFGVEE